MTDNVNLTHKRLFLHQAKVDPSFSTSIVRQFSEELWLNLELKSVRHEHAQFFSELVTEWLSDSDGKAVSGSAKASPGDTDASAYETLGRNEMHKQREEWASLVFTPSDVDE